MTEERLHLNKTVNLNTLNPLMISEFTVIYSAMNGGLATSIKFFKTTHALRIKNPTFVLDFLFLAIYSLTEPI